MVIRVSFIKKGFRYITVVLLSCVVGLNTVKAQIEFNYPLIGEAGDYPLLHLGGAASLTSGGVDLLNNGWLRLTNDQSGQSAYAIIDQSFPSSLGIVADFEYKTWGQGLGFENSLADGISVFLYDGNIATSDFNAGSLGGGLGYAPIGKVVGTSGGYVGIGFDEFGNFSNKNLGNPGTGVGDVRVPQSVAIRGPHPQYAYLKGTSTNMGNALDPKLRGQTVSYSKFGSNRPNDTEFYRKVRVTLLPILNNGVTKDFAVTAQLGVEHGGPLYTIFKDVAVGLLPPNNLKIGFAGSTGAAHANHEIRNLVVRTPVNLIVSNKVDLASARYGDQVKYTTVISNIEMNALVAPYSATFSIETDGVSLTTNPIENLLSSSPESQITLNSTLSTPSKLVYNVTNILVGGCITLTYNGTIGSTNLLATNTAIIDSPQDFANISTQNRMVATTRVIKVIDLDVKSFVNITTPQNVGARLSYTTTISNRGPLAFVGPESATFSLDLTGLEDLSTLTSIVSLGSSFVKNSILSQQMGKEIYDISALAVGQSITITYTAKVAKTNSSAINKVSIAYPQGYHDSDMSNNIYAVQNFTKPTLKLPASYTVCSGSSFEGKLDSDRPLTTYLWTASAPGRSTNVFPSSGNSDLINSTIINTGNAKDIVNYTITATITAPLVLTDGSISTTMVTLSDSKVLAVTVNSLSSALITILVTNNGFINYKEDVVFKPTSSLPLATYKWYNAADKTSPIFEDDHSGTLTRHNLSPGTHSYYVTVSNPDFCEGSAFLVKVVIRPIPIGSIPNQFSPDGDEHNDKWVIENIEQFPNCKLVIYDRRGNIVYAPASGYDNTWRGTANNMNTLQAGVYYYHLDLRDGSNPFAGSVTIVGR